MSKKTFKNTPLAELPPQMAFIGGDVRETVERPAEPRNTAETHYKLDPRYVEIKTKRVQLVMQPSLYAEAKAHADAQGMSFNELMHQALKNYLGKE